MITRAFKSIKGSRRFRGRCDYKIMVREIQCFWLLRRRKRAMSQGMWAASKS